MPKPNDARHFGLDFRTGVLGIEIPVGRTHGQGLPGVKEIPAIENLGCEDSSRREGYTLFRQAHADLGADMRILQQRIGRRIVAEPGMEHDSLQELQGGLSVYHVDVVGVGDDIVCRHVKVPLVGERGPGANAPERDKEAHGPTRDGSERTNVEHRTSNFQRRSQGHFPGFDIP